MQDATTDTSQPNSKSAYKFEKENGRWKVYVAPAKGLYNNWDWNKSIRVDIHDAYTLGYNDGIANTTPSKTYSILFAGYTGASTPTITFPCDIEQGIVTIAQCNGIASYNTSGKMGPLKTNSSSSGAFYIENVKKGESFTYYADNVGGEKFSEVFIVGVQK